MTETCPSCIGRGKMDCAMCYGTGYQQRLPHHSSPCAACGGSRGQTCVRCRGSGRALPYSETELASLAGNRRIAMRLLLLLALLLTAAAILILLQS